MSYNKENYRRVMAEFSKKNLEAKADAEKRRDELHRLFPEIAKIDSTLSQTGARIFGEAMKGKAGLDMRISKLQNEVNELSSIRAELLKKHGYPEDYGAVHYECEECEDTGFVGEKMCKCLKTALVMAGYESSGIGKLLKTQSFDTFDLSYYKGNAENFRRMEANFAKCRAFAENFDTKAPENLLMFGGTGLGKTHLSTSIARVVIDRGYDVLYVSSHTLFSEFEREQFGKGDADTRKYFDSELLIIDDLGTEASNRFTVSCLYNLINSRLLDEKSTIINTNLSHSELLNTYQDRIASRILGEYTQLPFAGKDVRMQKLTAKNG